MTSIYGLNIALSQMQTPAGGFDFSVLTQRGAGATASFNGGTVQVAITNAEKNETKQLAQVAKDPQVQRDIARYVQVVKSAKTIDDVLNDPIARKVLMTSAGLGAYVDQIALAKKALMSDPTDPNSLAARMQASNGAWMEFAQDFNLAKNGLDRLYDRQDGFTGKWNIALQREGESIEGTLEITKTTVPFAVNDAGEVTYSSTSYQATINGEIVPATIEGGNITLNVLWEDSDEHVHISKLTGSLSEDGMSAAGPQTDDGKDNGTWSAVPYYANAIAEVSDNYTGEKRLDMLDQQMPGLGSAILFKRIASKLDTPIKILGSALGRAVVTTALGLPKQLALQSINAQEKAITQRMDPAKLKNAHFADQIAQRYLIMLNGGAGGVTA